MMSPVKLLHRSSHKRTMSRQEELITQLQQEISILKRENEKLKTDLELIESELPYNKEYDV